MRFLILLLIPALAWGATVTLDGRVIDVERVEITTRSTPEPEPEPEPPADDCTGPWREGIDWSSPGGRMAIDVPRGGVSFAFETTSNPHYGGYINVLERTGQESVTRRIAILDCHGEPLPEGRCSRTGTGLITIPWLQRPYSGACSLEPNTRYYLQIDNVSGCGRTCGAYLSIPTNGRQ